MPVGGLTSPIRPFREEVPTTGDRINRILESTHIVHAKVLESALGVPVQPPLREGSRLPWKLLPGILCSKAFPLWEPATRMFSSPFWVGRSHQGSSRIAFWGDRRTAGTFSPKDSVIKHICSLDTKRASQEQRGFCLFSAWPSG